MAKLEYSIVSGHLSTVKQLTKAGYRLQTARELQNDRCKDGQESLQNDWFYVADGSVFYQDTKNGALSWAHTDGEHNLVIQPQYLERALKDLPQTYIFRPDNAQESWDAIKARSTNRFALSDLKLVREDDEFSFMAIKTGKYDALTPVQQKAASLVGFTPKNVAYLKQKGIKDTRLLLPNPRYIASVLAEEKDPFWRASWLDDFNGSSDFNALDRFLYYDGRLRGVRLVSEANQMAPKAQNAKKIVTIDDVLACLRDDVAPSVRPAVEDRLKKLYEVQ